MLINLPRVELLLACTHLGGSDRFADASSRLLDFISGRFVVFATRLDSSRWTDPGLDRRLEVVPGRLDQWEVFCWLLWRLLAETRLW